MFDKLREAFREAVANFKDELDRDEVPEAVDRLLGGMRDEAAEAQARVRKLESDLREALKRTEVEGSHAATCRRRESLAREIGDEETARVAREYAEKHEQRKEVLGRKALALQEELEIQRAEVAEMMDRIREAREQRNALAAQAGRTQARSSLDADDLFSELDRMAGKIGEDRHRADAARELDDYLDGRAPEPEAPAPELDVEARLAELKRRMKRE